MSTEDPGLIRNNCDVDDDGSDGSDTDSEDTLKEPSLTENNQDLGSSDPLFQETFSGHLADVHSRPISPSVDDLPILSNMGLETDVDDGRAGIENMKVSQDSLEKQVKKQGELITEASDVESDLASAKDENTDESFGKADDEQSQVSQDDRSEQWEDEPEEEEEGSVQSSSNIPPVKPPRRTPRPRSASFTGTGIKSTAVVKYNEPLAPARYKFLQLNYNTNLKKPPENWLRVKSQTSKSNGSSGGRYGHTFWSTYPFSKASSWTMYSSFRYGGRKPKPITPFYSSQCLCCGCCSCKKVNQTCCCCCYHCVHSVSSCRRPDLPNGLPASDSGLSVKGPPVPKRTPRSSARRKSHPPPPQPKAKSKPIKPNNQRGI